MFKWLIKTWKIWRLNRRWYEFSFKDREDNAYYVRWVCFGRMVQHAGDRDEYRIFRLNDDGKWGCLLLKTTNRICVCESSSNAVEQKYQEYLTELQELSML